MPRDRVFLSYSREDEPFMKEARVQLKAAGIETFIDQEIPIGEKWQDHIQSALADARVAFLLVSANFATSDFIRKVELPAILPAAESGDLTIFWVQVSACPIPKDIDRYQAAHRNPALDQMSKPQRNQVWADICRKLAPLFDP